MSKNNHSKVGQIISNDPTGRVLDPDEVIEGNSYKAAALPVGTKVSFVEKIPGKSVGRNHIFLFLRACTVHREDFFKKKSFALVGFVGINE